ncbi:ErmE/ErmH/ErmO/ErmR family 23S rRNA (adenine(2058)-N(6))-methyltransferase [Solwaraspora sp. WMMD406]|uniref:ErmE/ErmH/ErmO/ErmR family 23S rRNA (adenine(2058)-N(6))-methyltransferase n=1 Tax=Solwaraspora sp. WMMD406 TaxID=3016095 RepID=UPI0024179BCB|nr:ErmE/ErmH/ErmO/ErmR family 23S rRNA (adenine(2058)-N(6))-methyltransferase [Solwaraspora sp. WMMD406]MDG4767543.1 ErmE/ErmH/ErmO/ErmR family 23S rRNA (adenine(2058)-N(6))-methyltransferase [Solwaraspora sp. WMMD406]
MSSQTFLHDRTAIDQVVQAARPIPGQLVVEIGAGTGQLTRALAGRLVRRGDRLLAYEIDPDLFRKLTGRCRDLPNVTPVHADFLTAEPPADPFAVVGNIPYAATAPIVDWCLHAPGLRSATLVTQLEYARKRTGDYGRWSLLTVCTWPSFQWRLAGRIPPTAFRPVPRVASGILRLDRRPVPLLPAQSIPAYRRLVEIGFGGVGGSVAASLRRAYPAQRVAAAVRATRIPPGALAGELWPEQWLALFRLLTAPRRR